MRKGKTRAGFRWWGDWTIVWVIGSFAVVYMSLVPLKAHEFHWLFSFIGGVAGYGVGLLFDAWFPRVRGFVRNRSGTMTSMPITKIRQKRRR